MELKIKRIIDDRLNYHYNIYVDQKIVFIMGTEIISADSRLVNFLRHRLGFSVEQGFTICDKLLDNDEVSIPVPAHMHQ